MSDCLANVLVAEDAKQLSKFVPFCSELDQLRLVVQWTGEPDGETKAKVEEASGGKVKVLSWKQLIDEGKKESDEVLEDRLKKVRTFLNISLTINFKKCPFF